MVLTYADIRICLKQTLGRLAAYLATLG